MEQENGSPVQTIASGKRYPLWLFCAWIVAFGLAWYFACERVIYQDSAYGLFRICNFEHILDHGRWAAMPLYAPTYLAVLFSLPLKTLIVVFSVSTVFWYWMSSWAIWKWTKNTGLALIPLALFMTVGPEMFFAAVMEMNMALCYSSLLIASLTAPFRNKVLSQIAPIVFTALAFNAHPGILPFLIFIFCWSWYQNGWKPTIIPFSYLILMGFIKTFITQNSTYEQSIFGNFTWHNFTHFTNSWTWNSFFLGSFKSWMLLPALCFILWLILKKDNKSVLKTIVLCACVLFCIVLLNTIYIQGDSDMMMQKSFAPLAAICVLPLCIAFTQKNTRLILVARSMVVLTIVVGFALRLQAAKFYTRRITMLKSVLHDQFPAGQQKMLAQAKYFPADEWRVTWALPYESLLLSSETLGQSKTIKIEDSASMSNSTLYKKQFLGADFAYPMPINELNHTYFKLNDTAGYSIFTPKTHQTGF